MSRTKRIYYSPEHTTHRHKTKIFVVLAIVCPICDAYVGVNVICNGNNTGTWWVLISHAFLFFWKNKIISLRVRSSALLQCLDYEFPPSSGDVVKIVRCPDLQMAGPNCNSKCPGGMGGFRYIYEKFVMDEIHSSTGNEICGGSDRGECNYLTGICSCQPGISRRCIRFICLIFLSQVGR
jgi:hypothetical protein